jgi:suppressor for copper-sensitivity B
MALKKFYPQKRHDISHSFLMIVTFFIALMTGFLQSAIAADINVTHSDFEESSVDLIPSKTAVGQDETFLVGLDFKLKPGWKIYWRSPGDAGYPPSVKWQGSKNLADVVTEWPMPIRFNISGLETFGYEKEVIFPLIIRLITPGKPLSLKAHLDYLICSQICLPRSANFTLIIPAGSSLPTPYAESLDHFRQLVPKEAEKTGIHLVSAKALDSKTLKITLYSDIAFKNPDLFIEREGYVQFSAPRVTLKDSNHKVILTSLVRSNPYQEKIWEKPVTLTITDDNRSMEIVSDITKRSSKNISHVILMILVALLGGLTLNVMPCVLPVLSLKVFSLIHSRSSSDRVEEGDLKKIRASFIASASGVLVSFVILAIGTIILKAAGSAVGWGIQFQQPLFLGIMILALLLFSANLFGLFEFKIPQWIFSISPIEINHQGLLGDFMTGMLATLLATPCSAPFVGTAIGFALANGYSEILMIFLSMGIGMSSPYLIFALFPRMMRFIPKPGQWMVRLRMFLGLLLLMTALWLGSLMIKIIIPKPYSAENLQHSEHFWQNFDQAEIAKQVQLGYIVFVDVTADWCLTCQINKKTVIMSGQSLKKLSQDTIIKMEADWTKPNDEIASYLSKYGRYAIPFNIVYGPAAPEGIVLPEILTQNIILEALEKAEKG